MEEKIVVRGFELTNYRCDECGGTLIYQPYNNSIKFTHKCDKCGIELELEKIYPAIEYF